MGLPIHSATLLILTIISYVTTLFIFITKNVSLIILKIFNFYTGNIQLKYIFKIQVFGDPFEIFHNPIAGIYYDGLKIKSSNNFKLN